MDIVYHRSTLMNTALGIGAKTSSGYGRMKLEAPSDDSSRQRYINDPELQRAEGYTKEIMGLPTKDVANRIHGYYQNWQQMQSKDGRIILARAIIEKVRQAGREKATAEKAWYKELQAFLGESGI